MRRYAEVHASTKVYQMEGDRDTEQIECQGDVSGSSERGTIKSNTPPISDGRCEVPNLALRRQAIMFAGIQ